MMKKRVKRISALFLAVSVVSVWVASACPVYAAGDAQAHIGRIRPCAVLSEPDMEKAAENIKDSAVTVACLIGHGLLASNTGSGVVVGVYDDRLMWCITLLTGIANLTIPRTVLTVTIMSILPILRTQRTICSGPILN